MTEERRLRRSSSLTTMDAGSRRMSVTQQDNMTDVLLSQGIISPEKLACMIAKYHEMTADAQEVSPDVDITQFIVLLNELGALDEGFVRNLFNIYDVAKQGKVNFREMVFGLYKSLNTTKKFSDCLRLVFHMYDRDLDGKIFCEDVRDVLKVALARGTDYDPGLIQVICLDLFSNCNISMDTEVDFEKLTQIIKASPTVRECFAEI